MDFLSKVLGYAKPAVGNASGVNVASVRRAAAYKTSSYASVPYERFPQVTDTVPTKGLLPGYSTPEKVWVA